MSLDEKQQHYKCGPNYVTLEKIPTWPSTSKQSSSEYSSHQNSAISEKISTFVGDITTLEIDAIVNAANAQLGGGSGGTA